MRGRLFAAARQACGAADKMKTIPLKMAATLLLSAAPAYAAKTSAGSGNWSDPASWSPSGAPLAIDSVTIRSGDTITLDITTAAASTTTVNGSLIFSLVSDSSLTLSGGNIVVDEGGSLLMGTSAQPMPAGILAHLVLASGTYAGQYGLIVNNGGNFIVRGSTKTPDSYATQGITTADTSLTVYGSTSTDGWQVGDVITIGPTSGNGTATTSSRTITSIAGGPSYTVNWSGGGFAAGAGLDRHKPDHRGQLDEKRRGPILRHHRHSGRGQQRVCSKVRFR